MADTCTRIRNALARGRRSCSVVRSKLTQAVLDVLQNRKLIAGYEVQDRAIVVRLRVAAMRSIRAVSLPSVKRYTGYRGIFAMVKPWEVVVLSTPVGVLDAKAALKAQVGGLVLLRAE